MHKTCKINLWHAHQQAITHVILIRCFSCIFFFILAVQLMICIITFFNICIEWILSELSFFLVYARHMRSATLIFKSFSQFILSFSHSLNFQSMSFINVSLCSVDAAHMHRRGFDGQMWIYLWSRLMLLTYLMLRIGPGAFPTRRQVLDVRGICHF